MYYHYTIHRHIIEVIVVIIENIMVSKYLSPNMELQPITSKVLRPNMELNPTTTKVDSNLRIGVVHTTLFDRDCH